MKSKTQAQKALSGTQSASKPLFTEQAVLAPVALSVPSHLANDSYVNQFWREHVLPLSEAGALFPTDAGALEAVAVLYSLYRKAAAQAAQRETVSYTATNGNEALHPDVKMAQDLAQKLIRALDTVGLTPARREKLQRPVTPDDADPMENYLRVAK